MNPCAESVLVLALSAAGARKAWLQLVGLLAGVIVLFGIAGLIVYFVRRRMMREEAATKAVPLTLHDVRVLRARGEIDDAEYERLKAVVLAQSKKQMAPPPGAEPDAQPNAEPNAEPQAPEPPAEETPKT
jgi:uncharacterized membrane protein